MGCLAARSESCCCYNVYGHVNFYRIRMLLDARTTVVRILFMICWVAIFDHVLATHLRTTRTAHPRKNSANSFHACKLAKPKALTDDSLAALADADQSQMPLASFKIEAPAKTGGRHINVCYVCNWSCKNGVGALQQVSLPHAVCRARTTGLGDFCMFFKRSAQLRKCVSIRLSNE